MPEQLWAKDLPLDEQVHSFTVGGDCGTDLQLLPFDAEASAAHARMLGEAGLLPEGEAKVLVAALARLKGDAERGHFAITPQQEDCHTALENALQERLGATGRRIHLGRSRNDQVQTALRLLMRERLLGLAEGLTSCACSFLNFAHAHADAALPGYTHMRRAMPASWGMWSAAFAEGLLEELAQLPSMWLRLDQCPLGAAAGFGVPLPIDRARTAELLGFSRVQRSPIDVMNARGRHEQVIAAWIVSAAGTLEKGLWDLLIWSTEEFGFVWLPDAFTTGSSLMPQKRNPDVLELARGRCRELRGLAGLLSHISGSLPSSYHRDQQLTKAPFLEIVGKGEELFYLIARLVPVLQIDEEACAAACSAEIRAADAVCRMAVEGMPFRDAYVLVARQLHDETGASAGAVVTDDTPNIGDLHLGEIASDLSATKAWIEERRQFLAATTERLFAWL